ncbi:HET-domain-containing protein [Apiospora arundinis]
MFQKFTLRVRDKINVGGHDVERKNILLAELSHDRSSTDWTEGQPQPLWDQGRSYSKLCLEFYTRPGEPSIWTAVPEYPEPWLDSTSDEAMSRVKTWLGTCLLHHLDCGQRDPALPSRVLFVSEDPQENIRLVSTNEGARGAYTALSWRWGEGEKPLKTTKSVLRRHQQGISPSELPRLFRDAAMVTRKLGLKYLWIDSLCIIQDSQSDWEAEAGKMAETYGNAHLTIAADACANAYQGLSGNGPFRNLFFLDDGRYEEFPYIHRDWAYRVGNGPLRFLLRSAFETPCPSRSGDGATTNVRVRVVTDHNTHGYHGNEFLPRSLLDKRGWCLQENLLSRRILHFGQTELSWQCREMECCECTRDVRSSVPEEEAQKDESMLFDDDMITMKNKLLGGVDMAKNWLKIVENFTWRHLGEHTDRLPALEGVARAMMARGHLPESDYLAGLWRSHISSELAWFVKPLTDDYTPVKYSKSRRVEGVPTWSWGSVTGAVWFARGTQFQVLHIATPPAAKPFVVLRGQLWKPKGFWYSQLDHTNARDPKWRKGFFMHRVDMGDRGGEGLLFLDDWDYRPGQENWALQVSPVWSLLLERVSEPHIQGGLTHFKRVGMLLPKELEYKGFFGNCSTEHLGFKILSVAEQHTIALV